MEKVPPPDEPLDDEEQGSAQLETDSWAPIDLGPYLRGEVVRPEPSVGLARTDGLRLLYPGKEHMVIGEMESGKSWYALGCAMVELLAGRHVLYVHFEEADPGDTIDRLRALGVGSADILALFRFVGPERPVSPAALAALLDTAPSLVVLDGVNEAMSLHAQGIMDPDGSAAYRRRLVKPCTRAGAAVLSCDHVSKDPERRGRGPIGSVHKGNGLSGSLIVLDNADPFGRGARGRSHVFVTKDRPGHLRRHGRPGKERGKTYLGELVVDDTQAVSPDLLLRFYAPRQNEGDADGDGEALPPGHVSAEEILQEVLATVEKIAADGHEPTVRKIRAAASFRSATVDTALERLVMAGALTESVGARNARVFTVSVTVSQDQEASDAS